MRCQHEDAARVRITDGEQGGIYVEGAITLAFDGEACGQEDRAERRRLRRLRGHCAEAEWCRKCGSFRAWDHGLNGWTEWIWPGS